MPNSEEGTYQIEVTATMGAQQTSAMITQTNAVAPEAPQAKKRVFGWRLLAAIGAGVAIGVTAAILRDDEATAVNPTTVRLGTVTVGTPR
jgi:hypothetical protein